MLYDSLNHVINAFSPQGCWVPWFRRKEVESAHELDCVARTVHHVRCAQVRCLLGFLFRKVMQKH